MIGYNKSKDDPKNETFLYVLARENNEKNMG